MDIIQDIYNWIITKPKWQQYAAHLVINNDKLENATIDELTELCLKNVENDDFNFTLNIPASSLQEQEGIVRIQKLYNIKNIASIKNDEGLDFTKNNLSIIYGNNGSGKTSYYKLLKRILKDPNIELLRNIYVGTKDEQTATVSYVIGKDEKTLNLTNTLNIVPRVYFYDKEVNPLFLEKGAEIEYIPSELLIFDQMIAILDKIKNNIENRIGSLKTHQKPSIPLDLKDSFHGKWYNNITYQTSMQDVEKFSSFTDEDKEMMNHLIQRINEKSPKDKIREISQKIDALNYLKDQALHLCAKLSDCNFNKILSLFKNYQDKKNIAEQAAKNIYKASNISGIGSDPWRAMWQAAKQFSKTMAYPDTDFPNINDEARCVLCHQKLDDTAKHTMLSLENYVTNSLNSEADNALDIFNNHIRCFTNIPDIHFIKAKCDISQIEPNLRLRIENTFNQILSRAHYLLVDLKQDTIPLAPIPLLDQPSWQIELDKLIYKLTELRKLYEYNSKDSNNDLLYKQLNELKAKEFISHNRDNIIGYIQRSIKIHMLENALNQTNTATFTTQKKQLFSKIVTNEYLDRFNSLLTYLTEGHVKLELNSKSSKGQILFQLKLKGVITPTKPVSILSEGEKQVSVLAGFLASALSSNDSAPIILDDPLSSLDSNYEEALLRKLVELAQSRQIILFTHRLSAIGTIASCASNVGMSTNFIFIQTYLNDSGVLDTHPLQPQGLKSRLNTLFNTAKQLCVTSYQLPPSKLLLYGICTEFRKLIESSIEQDLFCGIIQRHKIAINTLKFKELHCFSKNDIELFNNLLTKYSNQLHPETDEIPHSLPDITEVISDIEQFINWRNVYRKNTRK